MSERSFFLAVPKVELHAHLNGSISPVTMAKLVKLHKDQWPGEKMPDNCDLMIQGGEYGSSKDPFLIFPLIHAVTDNMEAVRMVTRDVIEEFRADGVRYLELRTTPREVRGRMTRLEYCHTVLDTIIASTSDHSDDHSGDHTPITVKLLLSIDRRLLATMDDIVSLYTQLRANPRYSHILAGLDISGDPRVGDLRSVVDRLAKLRQEGVRVAVHLAETVNHEETSAVLAMAPDRIGHGTCIHQSLGGSDTCWSQLTRAPCPVEVCLSSNVVCHTVPSYHQHQANIYYQHGVPIVLCTDDKGVFGSDLSNELKIAAETFGWSLQVLYTLQYQALDHAFIGDKERQELRKYWDKWKQENSHYF